MDAIEISSTAIVIRFTKAELMMVKNALNETLEEVDVQEFHSRIGFHPHEVEVALEKLVNLVAQMKLQAS